MPESTTDMQTQAKVPPPRKMPLERHQTLKTWCEMPLVILLFLALMPLLLLLILLIKCTSKGPVIYRAKRLGKHGQTIQVLKFRTMFFNADLLLEALLDENPDLKREWQRQFKLENDPRITAVGKFLRRTSLDELPQLWNVLRGEMSLVGPRPIVEQEQEYYGVHLSQLMAVKPGMTGMWQVSRKNDTTYAERVAMDMCYIATWTPWLDLKILAKTTRAIWQGQGAR